MPAGVIGHVQPVASLEAVAVERQRQVIDRVGDEQRDELFGVVIRPVGIRAAGDDRIEPVGHHVAPHQEFTAGLRGGVRGARGEDVALAGVSFCHGTVDLVRRDLEITRPLRRRPAGLQQHVDADHPGHEERLGVQDGAVDVRLRREVEHRIDVGHEVVDHIPVGDVADHEPQACVHLRVGADRRQVGLVASVGQLVEDGDLGAIAPARGRRGRSTTR